MPIREINAVSPMEEYISRNAQGFANIHMQGAQLWQNEAQRLGGYSMAGFNQGFGLIGDMAKQYTGYINESKLTDQKQQNQKELMNLGNVLDLAKMREGNKLGMDKWAYENTGQTLAELQNGYDRARQQNPAMTPGQYMSEQQGAFNQWRQNNALALEKFRTDENIRQNTSANVQSIERMDHSSLNAVNEKSLAEHGMPFTPNWNGIQGPSVVGIAQQTGRPISDVESQLRMQRAGQLADERWAANGWVKGPNDEIQKQLEAVQSARLKVFLDDTLDPVQRQTALGQIDQKVQQLQQLGQQTYTRKAPFEIGKPEPVTDGQNIIGIKYYNPDGSAEFRPVPRSQTINPKAAFDRGEAGVITIDGMPIMYGPDGMQMRPVEMQKQSGVMKTASEMFRAMPKQDAEGNPLSQEEVMSQWAMSVGAAQAMQNIPSSVAEGQAFQSLPRNLQAMLESQWQAAAQREYKANVKDPNRRIATPEERARWLEAKARQYIDARSVEAKLETPQIPDESGRPQKQIIYNGQPMVVEQHADGKWRPVR